MKGTRCFLAKLRNCVLALFFSLISFLLNPLMVNAQNHGDVVRAQGDTKIYLIQSGQRRAFATENLFRQMGYKLTDIKELDAQTLTSIPEGPPIWSREIVGAFPDGTLIRLKGTVYTYVIQGGRKCYIPDSETFQSKGYQWDKVQEVDKATFDRIVTGIPIPSAKAPYQYPPPAGAPTAGYPSTSPGTSSYPAPPTPGPSYPSSSPGTTSPSYPSPSSPPPSSPPSISYPSPGSYPSSSPSPGYSPSYPSTSSIFPNGTLVKGSGPDIYVIENGVKRLIPDVETFKNFGFDHSKITTIDDMKLKSLPLGIPLPKK